MNLYIPAPFRYQAEVLLCREAGKDGILSETIENRAQTRREKQSPVRSLNQYLGTGRSAGWMRAATERETEPARSCNLVGCDEERRGVDLIACVQKPGTPPA
jgi:hypothetical protein